MSNLTYSIAIATRNRPDALRLSLPCMLSQSRKPNEIIIVDSSDDHSKVERVVAETAGDHKGIFKLLHTGRGSAYQRNVALNYVNEPIVFFPDDDSIWYPDTAAHTMDAYEMCPWASAVCAAEASIPPNGFSSQTEQSYNMRRSDKLKREIAYRRSKIENRLCPDPFKLLGQSFFSRFSTPNGAEENQVVPVEWMTGFRMSFRSDVIRESPFDESLGAYALNEDIDASFGAWKAGAVVAARRAKVYHHKFPARRDDGKTIGAITVLNKAYITAKHSRIGDTCRLQLIPYFRLLLLRYLLAARPGYTAQRYLGALQAYKACKIFVDCDSTSSSTQYRMIRTRILGGDASNQHTVAAARN